MLPDATHAGPRPIPGDDIYALARTLLGNGAYEQAFERFAEAAANGHVAAAIEAARMALHGVGTPRDSARALAWLHAAEREGHPAAAYHLAWLGVGGQVQAFDAAMQARLLRAANAGHPASMLALAVYFGRKASADDQVRCIALLEHAANLGNAVAAQLLAERLVRGEGCIADPAAAQQLYTQLDSYGHPRLPEVPGGIGVTTSDAAGVLELGDLLRPPPATPLSHAPRVALVEDALSTDECRLLIAHSQPRLRRSRAVDPATGLPLEVALRTSSDTSFDPLSEDVALRLVQLRMAAVAGRPLAHAEQLTVLRYLPGEEYRPHRDYLPPGSRERDHPEAGNRIRTICVYLNTVDAGGATAFPHAGLHVAPKPGRAIVFDNLHADGRPDPNSLHAGTPVQAGEKWLATLWIRQHTYRAL